MIELLKNTWALLLGMLLLMLGNGMQGSLLGIRGAIEGFGALEMSLVMSGYFLGFLVSSRATPAMIRRVGHVRVFAAMASIISAAFILYAALPNIWAWALLRVVVGGCFASVYVVAESWLNDGSTNETRGQALSAYMIVQMTGIVAAQGLLNLGDPSGYGLFVLISVAVSLSFAPILLSVSPAPVHEGAAPMTLKRLFDTSPLGCVGMFFLGGVFAALFGMAAVYGTERGLQISEITIFIAMIYTGGLLAQYPVGWISDRLDRRTLIFAVAAVGAAAGVAGLVLGDVVAVVLIAAFLIGGAAHPLYSLLIAHTNDHLEPADMPSASGGLIFMNGVGAIGGPLAVGAAMNVAGPDAYFAFLAALFGAVAAYAAWRSTRRAAVDLDDQGHYAPVMPQASPVAVETAVEYAVEYSEADEAEADGAGAS